MALPAALLLLTGVAAAAIGRRPNVITILTDDQGFGDNGYYCENSTGACLHGAWGLAAWASAAATCCTLQLCIMRNALLTTGHGARVCVATITPTGLCASTPNIDALATSPHSAIFHRFYSAAGVCSPTRAALLTGRTNQRDCIWSALTCDSENPAPGCSMGTDGSLPWSEFTTAKAAHKAGLTTIHIGKCERAAAVRWLVSAGWPPAFYAHVEERAAAHSVDLLLVNSTLRAPRGPMGQEAAQDESQVARGVTDHRRF